MKGKVDSFAGLNMSIAIIRHLTESHILKPSSEEHECLGYVFFCDIVNCVFDENKIMKFSLEIEQVIFQIANMRRGKR